MAPAPSVRRPGEVCTPPRLRALAASAMPSAAAAAAAAATTEAEDAEADTAVDPPAQAHAGAQTAAAAEILAGSAEVFIIRHGERADRANNRDDGWIDDPPLTKEGRQTAKSAGAAMRSLASLPWAPAVYSSPYYRCLQTANELAAELGLPVRVEPGLSELCIQRIFDQQPCLRGPDEALASALQRVEVDTSVAPTLSAPPQWPEEARHANVRVLHTARALIARHPGQAVCLICHSHSLVEITRHLPKTGGGAIGSQAGYCAMSHIAMNGQLLRGLDVSYIKHADLSMGAAPGSALAPETSAGNWMHGWQWQSSDSAQTRDPIDALLDMDLDEVLTLYSSFMRLFSHGTSDKQQEWRVGWASRCPTLRKKLQQARASGLFDIEPASKAP
mmetsp:Transcript_52051/g.167473  ORF Transcript_52051/g.167473 Transcript_52051/m.167473 type:complete len:389 (+) Transcript_52051:971-2137(+)